MSGEERLEAVADRLELLAEDLRSQLDDLRASSLHGPVPEFLTIPDLMKELRVGERTLRRLRARRGFPKPVSGPGRLRWRGADVQEWKQAGRSPRTNPTRSMRRTK